VSFTILGLISLYIINPKTAMWACYLHISLYTSVYTPLKTKTALSVFIGALPGAIPFMLGWVAARNDFGIEPGTLFAIQFFGSFLTFGPSVGFCMRITKKAGFLCCLRVSQIKVPQFKL
jgi:protoheme IX farnesyltransferase